ncbi:MAG: FHA domain-containing protein [Microbacteriaceae bacterium]
MAESEGGAVAVRRAGERRFPERRFPERRFPERRFPERWFLEDAAGTRHPVDAILVLGRAPGPAAELRGCRALVLGGDDSLSKAHLLVEPEEAALAVTDLGSTNGTVVGELAGARRPLPPGERRRLPVGTVLELGDCVLTVIRL